jgi:ammonium transporter, Amt family
MNLSRQLVAQLIGVLVGVVWSAGWTFALVKIVGAICGIRVSPEEESDGLDLATHGERAYDHS